MTHDELLAGIDEVYNSLGLQTIAALRAVVELHKPTGIRSYESYCLQCMKNNGDGIIVNIGYPCPTIQAIEKELQ
jgi:hypothetical protein